MSLDDIWYFDPFDPTSDLTVLTSPYETYTVRRYTVLGASWYGIQLQHPPSYKDLPSSVSPDMTRKVRIVKDDDPGYDYSEVSQSTAPSSDQFRVDYDNRNITDGTVLSQYKSTGLIQFNSTELDQVVRVYYWKTGPGVLPQSMATILAGLTILGTLGIQGVLTLQSDLNTAGDHNLTGDLHISGDIIPTGTDALPITGDVYISGDAEIAGDISADNLSVSTAKSDSCGSFSTASGTFVDITNLSVEITSNGSPILIQLVSDANGTNPSGIGSTASGTQTSSQFRILRDSTEIYLSSLSENVNGSGATTCAITVPPSSIGTIDDPGPGTYTYKLQAKKVVGEAYAGYSKLAAYVMDF